MQQHIRVIYTAKLFNPVSWLIRWMVGPSKVSFTRSSHGMVVDGVYAIEAHMIFGVRRVPLTVALHGATVVLVADYPVDDAEAGLGWFRSQVCTYIGRRPAWLPKPLQELVALVDLVLHNNYDYKGALGLGIAPDRNWQSPDNWFCYEGIGRALKEAGLNVFAELGHITEGVLLAIRHCEQPPACVALVQ
jgi:hypothetical protein